MTATNEAGRALPPAGPPSCFITGTDTGVGKTLVTAAIVRALVAGGVRAVGMKPVAAGAQWQDGAWRNDDVEALFAAGNGAARREELCPYLLHDAIAPHIAAERAGVRIDLNTLLRAFARLRTLADAVVVEGVGGFCVPLGSEFGTADLAQALGLPVVLVVGVRLGCLNHAALTVEAIAARGLRLAGWVANTIDPQMAQVDGNIAALGRIVAAPCLGRVPWLGATADPAALRLDITALTGAIAGGLGNGGH